MGNSTGKLYALRRQTQYKEDSKLEDKTQDECETPNCLPLDFLKDITSNFSEAHELGRDRFGVLYKGVFGDGKVIAVKKLSETHIDDDQFQKEVTFLLRLKHRNIVRLVGYCNESRDWKYVMPEMRKRLLCYEYTTYGSLDNHIISRVGLGWDKRYRIIIGIYRGLHYLHTEFHAHMNLKPQNILLDENMEPKIADFGMFRLFDWHQSQIIKENDETTVGYMAPEYFANGLVSTTADIFSLGVIIIELMNGRRDYPSTEESYEQFVENVIASWRERLELEEAAGRYKPLERYVQQVKTCILMGLMCVNVDPNKRPTTRDILEKLTENMNEGANQLVHFDVGFTPDLEELLRADAEVLRKHTYGTVYKAELENGSVVFVRMFRVEMTKDQKDFKAEVAVLGKIRHPNLVPPIACYVGGDEKLIIMDYMPRGSLSAFLHGHGTRTLADWGTRMEIARGIIHGNLTSRNVLLDEHSDPKVADFGLFRLLTPDDISNVLAAASELGYRAPELSSPMNASTKTDVYSLGIIILELVTGKMPSSMDLPRFVGSRADREEWWSDILDQKLMLDEDAGPSLDELEGTLKLALECVDPMPSSRPRAWEVLCKLAIICRPGPKNAAKPSEDRSPSLDLEARDDDAGTRQSEDDDLSLSARMNDANICPAGSSKAARPSEDRSLSPESELEARDDLDHVRPGLGDCASTGASQDDHSLSARINDDEEVPEPEQDSSEEPAGAAVAAWAQQQRTCSQSGHTGFEPGWVGSAPRTRTRRRTNRTRLGMQKPSAMVVEQEILEEHIWSGSEETQEESLEQLTGQIQSRPEDEAVLSEDGPRIETQAEDGEVIQHLEHVHLNGSIEQSSAEWRQQQQPADLFQESFSVDHYSGGGLPLDIPFHLLEEITNDFSDECKLGSGAFGKVYMGVHKDGEKIAVKMLYDMPGLNEEQFLNEFSSLAKLQHPNIVRLVGYCHEIRKTCVEHNGRLIFAERMALCFEYMPFGSLDKYLSDEYNGLDWNVRYTLIKGICEGLKYLHEELRSPIYHLDLKPANILLDENMLPKIADFGLSRFFADERSHITRSSIGTLGYLPPEYIERNIISDKFDIFSLGVVIIKIMTGPTGYNRSTDMSPQEFIELAHENWMKRLQGAPMHLFESYSIQVKKCMEIALSSVVADRHKRPSIGDIIRKLNDDT